MVSRAAQRNGRGLIDERRARLGSVSAWALASVLVGLFFALLRTVVIARVLDPIEIGLMGIALLALGTLEAVTNSGVDTALVARRTDVEPYLDPTFTIQVARGLLLFALLWVLAPLLARAFHSDAAVSVIRSVAAIAVLRGIANPAAVYAVRELDFRRVFWWSLPEVVASFCLTVAFAVVRRDVWALVIGSVGGQLVGSAASYGLVPRRPRVVLHRARMRSLLQFGKFVSGSRALMYLSVNLDSAVVGMSMGTHALGLYQFAVRVAELPVVTFTRALAQVALPTLSGLHTSAAALRQAWWMLVRWVLTTSVIVALAIVLFGAASVRVLVGERWLDSVPAMRILAVAMLFRAMIVLTGQLLDAVGRPAETLRLNAVRFAALLVVLPPLAAWDGLRGAAQAVLLANAGAAILAVRMSWRACAD